MYGNVVHWGRKFQHAILLGLLLSISMTSAAEGLESGENSVTTLLDSPVRQVHEQLLGSATSEDQSIEDALAKKAYRSALTLMAERLTNRMEQSAWEDAQRAPDPPKTFLKNISAQLQAQQGWLSETANRLALLSKEPVSSNKAEHLLLVAHFLVYAERSHELGLGYLGGGAGQDPSTYLQRSQQRYVVVRPMVMTSVFLEIANKILDRRTGLDEGPFLNVAILAAQVDKHGGAGNFSDWPISEAGPFHKLARHIHGFENIQASSEKGATLSDVEAALEKLESSYDSFQEAGFSGLRQAAVYLDGTWWVQRSREGYQPSWEPMIQMVYASVEGARYEAELLKFATSRSETIPMEWIWVGGGAALVGTATIVGYTLARRAGRTRHGGHSSTKSLAAAAFLLLLLASTSLMPPATGQSPLNPESSPVVVTESDPYAGMGNFALTPDGKTHFVWQGCESDPAREVCPDIRYRYFDRANRTWSTVIELRNVSQHAFFPRIYYSGTALHVFWLEGGAYEDHEPILLWWCLLRDGCENPQPISDPSMQAFGTSVTSGPDGMLRVVWEEDLDYPENAWIRFRKQTPQGWGPVVSFPTGSTEQRFPAVAVDREGRAHVAWREKPPEEGWGHYRNIMYATIEPETSTPSPARPLSHMSVTHQKASLAVNEFGVHAVYSTSLGVFHREKPLFGGNWSDPVEIARTGRQGGGPAPKIQAVGSDLFVSWTNGTINRFKFWVVERKDGFWQRPNPVVQDPPYNFLFLHESIYYGPAGEAHLTWTGSDSNTDPNAQRMYYRIIDPSMRAVSPPSIGTITPSDNSWVANSSVRLSASVLSDAPIDLEKTRWSVDGLSLPIEHQSTGISTRMENLLEGWHQAVLTLYDRQGNKVEKQWRFGVDQTAPELKYRVQDSSGIEGVTGWRKHLVTIQTENTTDNGSPVKTQIQFNEGLWSDIEGSGKLSEGSLAQIRLRAIDAAGNVKLGNRSTVGWDGTAPDVQAEVKPWSTTGKLVVRIWENSTQKKEIPPPQRHEHDHAEDTPHAHEVPLVFETGLFNVSGAPVHVNVVLRSLDGLFTESRSVPLAQGEVILQDLASGLYEVSLDATDEAGNQQNTTKRWRVGVDLIPPMLETTKDSQGRLNVKAWDDLSGVRLLQVRTHNKTLLEWTGNGTLMVEERVDLPPETKVHVRLQDEAGHVRIRTLSFDASQPRIEQDMVLQDSEDSGKLPIVPLESQSSIPLVHGEQDSNGIPSLSLLWVLLMVGLAGYGKGRLVRRWK